MEQRLEPREWNLDGKPFVSHMKRVSDKTYSVMLDTAVIACTDICVLDGKGSILLGKRQQEPLFGEWWTMGGRMFPGESFGQSAARKLKEEIGIGIDPRRFQFLNLYSCINGKRAQGPKNHGCHMMDVMMAVALTEKEIQEIEHNTEYSEAKWWPVAKVLTGRQFIDPLKEVMKDLMARF